MPRLLRSLLPLTQPLRQASTQSTIHTIASSSIQPMKPSSSVYSSLRSLSTSLLSSPSPFSSLSALSGLSALRSATPTSSVQAMQVRYRVMGAFYKPSQFKRKRKHGFLVRLKTKDGRKMMLRRLQKGRRFVSH